MAALGHFFAFPYKEYSAANIGVSPGFTTSLGHALMLNDFYHDTVHQVSLCSFLINVSHIRLVAKKSNNKTDKNILIETLVIFNLYADKYSGVKFVLDP